MAQTALKYDVELEEPGRLELDIPFPAGAHVTVFLISNSAYNQKTADIVVVAMTSNPAPAEYSFPITSSDLEKGTLNRPGKVRVDRIYTLSQSIVVKTFGRVNEATLDRIRQTLGDLTEKSP